MNHTPDNERQDLGAQQTQDTDQIATSSTELLKPLIAVLARQVFTEFANDAGGWCNLSRWLGHLWPLASLIALYTLTRS
jgi:hypothetical protein